MQKYTKRRLLAGWGINDEDEYTNGFTMVDGKAVRWECEYYKRWRNIVVRCYNEGSLEASPTYTDVNICEQWKYFTVFKDWMKTKPYHKGLHLDKDILFQGNKVYSPETCAFVPQYVNKSLLIRENARGEFPLGVSIKSHDPKRVNNLQAGMTDGNRRISFGVYADPMEGHRAWQVAKAQQLETIVYRYKEEDCYLADVGDALLMRVHQLRDYASRGIETTFL